MRANRVIISTPDMTPFRDLLDAGKIGVVVSNHLFHLRVAGH